MASRAGSPNKNRAFLIKRLQDMYGEDFDPIMKMAENAVLMQQEIEASEERSASDRKAVIESWDRIGQYIMPKLKSVEMDATVDSTVNEAKVDEYLERLISGRKAKPAE